MSDVQNICLNLPAAISKNYVLNEDKVVKQLREELSLTPKERKAIVGVAHDIVSDIRTEADASTMIDSLLQEYGLSTEEGVTLMRLAEALIRTPDFHTSRRLIRDKIGEADWSSHSGKSASFSVNRATQGLNFTSAWISRTGGTAARNLLSKLGDRVMDSAISQAMSIMARHFVLGRSITEAMTRAESDMEEGFSHSYDMLGEAALTQDDADFYFDAYLKAINALAANAPDADIDRAPGLSVKLSALHPRYFYAQRELCVPVLVERVAQLGRIAKEAGLWLNIDAEEAERLEISLEIFEKLLQDDSLSDWDGLGLVVQAYQRRGFSVAKHVVKLARKYKRRIGLRLVKGAYWDSEIKRAQEMGLTSYPVFTRKENTDLSYLACAQFLLANRDIVFPQFATHNAHTACAIGHMAGDQKGYEFQRLHGMGDSLHLKLMKRFGVTSRVYAPVGDHKSLLPYLVRRLLENGANSSFVNQLMDEDISIDGIVADPVATVVAAKTHQHPRIPDPCDILENNRQSASGIDLTQAHTAERLTTFIDKTTKHNVKSIVDGRRLTAVEKVTFLSPQNKDHVVGEVSYVDAKAVDAAVNVAKQSEWVHKFSPKARRKVLLKAADMLEAEMDDFLEVCVREAGKTLLDGVAEAREAIDFCRYYADQAQRDIVQKRKPLGIVTCISPWNFPLAIFLGQVVAALSVGNTVIAKPAGQTPIVAAKAADLLYRAGLPKSALSILIGDGAVLGTALARHPEINGICFTGSTRTAKIIAKNLAETGRAHIPFIAETGGINAMIVDSTALPEQAVEDVVASAFQSAGQRCSACRVLCVQEDIYDDTVEMLIGAMDQLVIADPANLATDVGPVIDAQAKQVIEDYKAEARQKYNILKENRLTGQEKQGFFTAPMLIEVDSVTAVEREIFGPVLHITKFKAKNLDKLLGEINSLNYGLTLGLHTRIDEHVRRVSGSANVGNIYVNRNQIGAVVGVNPFGGENLSGTGPKAGGPHYLLALTGAAEFDEDQPTVSLDMKPNGDPDLLEAVIQRAKSAAKAWQAKGQEARLVQLATLAKAAKTPVKSRLRYEAEIALPGPSGEQNTLRLVSKSVILCFGGTDLTALKAQVALALAAGAAVVIAGDCTPDFEKTLKGLPKNLVQHVGWGEALAMIDHEIEGVVVDDALRQHIGGLVALRAGPILPILSSKEPIERFLHERTETIDTAAAGGNATLLALT